MKAHEKKAVERAMLYYFNKTDIYDRYGDILPEKEKSIPYDAVRLAQIRSGRGYDPQTGEAALKYAKKLMRTGI